jgi:hypothetical protein
MWNLRFSQQWLWNFFWDITPRSPLKVNRRFGSHLLSRWFLAGLFFDREDGGDMFFRNVGWLSTDYTALYPRRWYSSGCISVLLYYLTKQQGQLRLPITDKRCEGEMWDSHSGDFWDVQYDIPVFTDVSRETCYHPEDGCSTLIRKCRWTSSRLHGITS